MTYIGETAYLLDVDDFMFDRGGVTRLGGYLAGLLDKNRAHPEKLRVTPLNRKVSNRPVTGLELLSLRSHARRWMNPGIPRLIGTIHARKEAAIVNTGRANVDAWIEMTKRRLDYYGVGHLFAGMYFTPDGASTAESKAEAIKRESPRYERIVFVDDDPRTIFRLAAVVPSNVELKLFHQPLTHRLVPESAFAGFANVRHIDHVNEVRG